MTISRRVYISLIIAVIRFDNESLGTISEWVLVVN